MHKQKLINKRIEKNKTQEEVAFLLGITQSQYSRRECGFTKITKEQWKRLVQILDTDIESIYESDDDIYSPNLSKVNLYEQNLDNRQNITIEVMKKYIEMLEAENLSLKNQLSKQL